MGHCDSVDVVERLSGHRASFRNASTLASEPAELRTGIMAFRSDNTQPDENSSLQVEENPQICQENPHTSQENRSCNQVIIFGTPHRHVGETLSRQNIASDEHMSSSRARMLVQEQGFQYLMDGDEANVFLSRNALESSLSTAPPDFDHTKITFTETGKVPESRSCESKESDLQCPNLQRTNNSEMYLPKYQAWPLNSNHSCSEPHLVKSVSRSTSGLGHDTCYSSTGHDTGYSKPPAVIEQAASPDTPRLYRTLLTGQAQDEPCLRGISSRFVPFQSVEKLDEPERTMMRNAEKQWRDVRGDADGGPGISNKNAGVLCMVPIYAPRQQPLNQQECDNSCAEKNVTSGQFTCPSNCVPADRCEMGSEISHAPSNSGRGKSVTFLGASPTCMDLEVDSGGEPGSTTPHAESIIYPESESTGISNQPPIVSLVFSCFLLPNCHLECFVIHKYPKFLKQLRFSALGT